LRPVGRRLEGRRSGLPAAVRRSARRDGEHDPPGVCSDGEREPAGAAAMSARSSGAQRVAFASFVWTACIAAAKLAVGLSISSVALVGDGLHSCVDALATALTLAAVRWASKPPD